ncbi:hypothetical protein COP1_030275 [Malus domestica]
MPLVPLASCFTRLPTHIVESSALLPHTINFILLLLYGGIFWVNSGISGIWDLEEWEMAFSAVLVHVE